MYKYFNTSQQEGKETILVKFVIYKVVSQFQTCCNLRTFILPSTWSSSILPSHSLPLKPILILCHPLHRTRVPALYIETVCLVWSCPVMRLTDQGVRLVWQKQSRARAAQDDHSLFRITGKDLELT